MKRPLLLLCCILAAGFVLGSVGCEQHPVSETADHGAKDAKDQKASGH
jgi:hypothetical protein